MSGDSVRAVRNSNPGNLDRSTSNKWQGLADPHEMTPEQRAEKRFCVFKAPKWGFRAMAVLLINYQDKHELHTISGVINRWAPPSENDTTAYISHVCRLTGFSAAEFLNFHKYEDSFPVIKAIATHECGGWFFQDRDLTAGLTLAGVPPEAKPLAKSRTVQAGTVATAATAMSGVTESLSSAQDTLSGLMPYLDIAKYALLAVVMLSVGVMVWARIDDHLRAVR